MNMLQKDMIKIAEIFEPDIVIIFDNLELFAKEIESNRIWLIIR